MILQVRRRLGYLCFLLILLSEQCCSELAEIIRCGKPGVSSHCSVKPKGEFYNIGDTITYDYSYNDTYTKNPIRRTCLQNGSWSGRMPVCYRKIDNATFYENCVNKVELLASGRKDNAESVPCVNMTESFSLRIHLKENIFINKIEIDPLSHVAITVKVKIKKKDQECKKNESHFECPKGIHSEEIVVDLKRTRSHPRNVEAPIKLCVRPSAEIGPSCVRPDVPYKATGSSKRGINATYTINCAPGYELKGESNVLQCQSDATWTPHSPICELIGCDPLPPVPNGVFKSNDTQINATVMLECSQGYIPVDNDITHCLPTGFWTTLSFRCRPIQCDKNPRIAHGKGLLLDGSTFYGAKLKIDCDRGYVPVDSNVRECTENETWGNADFCREINCGPLRAEEPHSIGHWKSLNETSGAIRVLVCDAGYHIEGSPPVSLCLSNESWSYTTAVCKKTNESWISDWSPNTVLMIAVATGAGTAILVLCLAMCCMSVKKGRHSTSNSSVFHIGAANNILYNGKDQVINKTNTYDDVIELKSNPTNSTARKKRSALPHIPVDTDPVYAQPFETSSSKQTKTVPTSTAGDPYTAHIYAEPVDSQRPPSDPLSVCNNVSETWLRNGIRNYGRKMSLPGQSNTSDLVAQTSHSLVKICKPMRFSSNMGSVSERSMFSPKRQDSFTELINNAIYLDIKDRSFTPGNDVELHMIDNDIYQDDYFSHA